MNRTFDHIVAVGFLSLVLSACAHKPARDTQNFDSEAPVVKLREVDSFRVTDPEGPKVIDSELEQIPTEINPLVEKWVDYFQGRGRPHMERYLSRSTRYSKLMKKILRQNGLPEDLIYIALIESGFSHQATSRAAAVGYWQFIRGTGKRYGLEINPLVDERRDPVTSTQAAAEYFKGLYSVFGSWYLAMASYNVGENRVKREVMNHYTRDFWELARRKRFPKETVNYIPKFIAAKLIGNNPEKYGFSDVEYLTPIEFDHIQVSKSVNLKNMAAAMGMEYDELKLLNPKFRGEIAPLKGSSLELRIPIGQQQVALAAAEKSFVDKVEYVADAGDTEIHRVRSGESLYTIARKYHTTVAWLRDTNDLKNGRKLRIGQKLAVPDRDGGVKIVAKTAKAVKVVAKVEKTEDAETAATTPEIVTKKGVFYIVQPGDTLSAIADDYDSSIEELRRMNKMSKASVLKAGMKLKVPKDEGLPTDPSGSKLAKTEETKDANEPEAAVAIVSEQREPQSVTNAHVVKPGENLTTIARKYGVSIQALRQVNNLTKRSVLKIGSSLKIPAIQPASAKAAGILLRSRKSVNRQNFTLFAAGKIYR
jgi:membrane-bound lytic murein transglycosylase D